MNYTQNRTQNQTQNPIYNQNLNTGPSASSDIVATSDIGSQNSNYIDMGIANSGYNYPTWPWLKPLDGYLEIDGGDLWLATLTNNSIKFLISNSVQPGYIDATGIHMTGSLIGNIVGTSSWANNASSASYLNPGANIYLSQSYISSVTGASQPPFQPATIWWDDNAKTYAIYSDHPGVSLQLGQEQWIRCIAAETIPNGKAVYVWDAIGSLPAIKLAQADGLGRRYAAIGISTETISSGSIGFITTSGQIHDLDTSMFNDGDGLFLSNTTAGSFQNYPPLDPYEKVVMGYVLYANNGNGIIQVDIVGLNQTSYPFVGITNTPSITVNTNSTSGSTFTVGTGSVNLCTTADGTGKVKNYQLNSASFSIITPFLDTNYVIVAYNSGNPMYQLVTTKDIIDSIQTTLVYTVSNGLGGTFVYSGWDSPGLLLANKDYLRVQALRGIERESGCDIGIENSLNSAYVTITSGYVWQGISRLTIPLVNSSTDRTILINHSGSSSWSGSLIIEVIYDKYDNGTGLVPLENNDYVINWIYKSDLNTNSTFIQLGTSYGQSSDAVSSQPPTPPVELQECAFLVGRIICKNTNTQSTRIFQVDSAYTKTFTGAGITNHNLLNNIQGGITNEYYHLSSASYSSISDGTSSYANTSSYILSSNVHGIVTSASYAYSASWIPASNKITTADTASYILVSNIDGTPLSATSSSYSETSSYAMGIPTIKTGIIAGTSFGDSPKTASIIFAKPFINDNYSIVVTGESLRAWTVQNKLSGSFEINSNDNSSFSNNVFWQAMSVGEYY